MRAGLPVRCTRPVLHVRHGVRLRQLLQAVRHPDGGDAALFRDHGAHNLEHVCGVFSVEERGQLVEQQHLHCSTALVA